MTDEQIEKALDCCGYNKLESECMLCPYYVDGIFDYCAGSRLQRDALTLIKRLKKEKEEQFKRLSKEIYEHCSKIVDLQEQLAFERTEAIRDVFVPPCKVGQTIYFLEDIGIQTLPEIQPLTVYRIHFTISEDGVEYSIMCITKSRSVQLVEGKDFGKIAFLSREEAEKAVEERRMREK